MIVETVTTYKFTPEDKKLLSRHLPDDPCESCYVQGTGACCGCPEARKYEEMVKPYRDAGIYEIAMQLKLMESLEKDARTLLKRYNEIQDSLPPFLRKGELAVVRGM